ncbi:TPA: IS1-like element transposase [Serratia fonticola]
MKPVSRALKSKSPKWHFNGAGVHDTARTLKIGINTVIRTLKNSRRSE